MAGFAAPALDHLICLVKRKLKKIQHRPCLIGGCLAAADLTPRGLVITGTLPAAGHRLHRAVLAAM